MKNTTPYYLSSKLMLSMNKLTTLTGCGFEGPTLGLFFWRVTTVQSIFRQNMMSFRTLLTLIISIFVVTTLGGCKVYKFTSVSPDPTVTLNVKMGDEMQFSAVTSPANSLLKWCVLRYQSDDIPVTQAKATCSDPSTNAAFTYEAQADDNLYSHIEVMAQLVTAEVGTVIEPPGQFIYYATRASTTWKIIVGKNQTPPIWEGSVDIQRASDVDALEDFTTITGNLIFENLDTATVPVLDSVTQVKGDLEVLNNSLLTSVADLNLNPGLIIEGSFIFTNNANLVSLAGLNANATQKGLSVTSNKKLTHLVGLAGINTITGNVSFSNNSALSNLSALENLTSVTGNVSISDNASLASLSGLNNLANLGGSLSLNNNSVLTDLSALANLTDVPGQLKIWHNAQLQTLHGLDALTHAADISIYDNGALASLEGLKSLITVDRLSLEDNTSIVTLAGLENLQNAQYIYLANCGVTNLDGLENLNNTSEIRILDNPALVNLNGVGQLNGLNLLALSNNNSLISLQGLPLITALNWLHLDSNPSLMDISALSGLASVNKLGIWNNQSLCQQDVDALVAHILANGNVISWSLIESNKACN